MARQIDLDQLRCDREDGQLAAGIGRWPHDLAGDAPWAWHALCGDDLDACLDDPGFVYVRFGVDRDRADTNDDDPALKHRPGPADNNGL